MAATVSGEEGFSQVVSSVALDIWNRHYPKWVETKILPRIRGGGATLCESYLKPRCLAALQCQSRPQRCIEFLPSREHPDDLIDFRSVDCRQIVGHDHGIH